MWFGELVAVLEMFTSSTKAFRLGHAKKELQINIVAHGLAHLLWAVYWSANDEEWLAI